MDIITGLVIRSCFLDFAIDSLSDAELEQKNQHNVSVLDALNSCESFYFNKWDRHDLWETSTQKKHAYLHLPAILLKKFKREKLDPTPIKDDFLHKELKIALSTDFRKLQDTEDTYFHVAHITESIGYLIDSEEVVWRNDEEKKGRSKLGR